MALEKALILRLLLDGGVMPTPEELPDSIKGLSFQNAFLFGQRDGDFRAGLQTLKLEIERRLDQAL